MPSLPVQLGAVCQLARGRLALYLSGANRPEFGVALQTGHFNEPYLLLED